MSRHVAPLRSDPSQDSPSSATMSPQWGLVQSVRHMSGTASLLLAPSSHSSPRLTTPSPHSPGSKGACGLHADQAHSTAHANRQALAEKTGHRDPCAVTIMPGILRPDGPKSLVSRTTPHQRRFLELWTEQAAGPARTGTIDSNQVQIPVGPVIRRARRLAQVRQSRKRVSHVRFGKMYRRPASRLP